MGNFFIGLLISIIIAIIIIAIIIVTNGKKKAPVTTKASQGATTPPSTPATNTDQAGLVTPTIKSKFWSKFAGTLGVIILLVLTVVIVIWAYGVVKRVINNPKKPIEYHWVVDINRTRTIYFTGEYCEVIYLQRGMDISFENSSEPYCIKNKNNAEVCGEKGEDVGPKMPNSINNCELRFKSQNGKTGSIDIIFWVLVKK